MSGTGAVPADWKPDPTGRHQLRYWDGAQWTAWVADDGVQGEDPIAPSGPGDREAVLGRTRLRYALDGRRSAAGWRPVVDDAGTEVARVWRDGPLARLCDGEGAPVLTVTAARGGLTVDDVGGAVASVSSTRARSVSLKCKSDGARVLTVQFRVSLRGQLGDVVLLDGDKRQIGSVESVVADGATGATGTGSAAWWVLDRDPSLADPVRALAVAAPVMIDCYLGTTETSGDGPDLGMAFDD